MRIVFFVLPGRAVDAAVPSGGDIYDRRVAEGLAAAGWSVREVVVPGAWPRPGPPGYEALAAAFAGFPDGAVVVLDGLVAGAAPEVLVSAAGRLRLVALVHLPLADETGLPATTKADLAARERRALHAAAAVVVTSSWTARWLSDLHDLPADRVHVAHPGVDPAPLAPGTDGGTRLLCVAAVTPLKAQDVLVEALARVADAPWRCRCVGDLDRAPAYVDRVRALVRHYRLDDRVELAGPRTGDDLAAAYAAADLVVLVSHAESYGMVLTEALARGIPVLATGVGGVPEAFGAVTPPGGPARPLPDGNLPGMLVPPADPAALAAALRRWLERPGTRRQLRDAARARSTTLAGWDATVATVAGVLEAA